MLSNYGNDSVTASIPIGQFGVTGKREKWNSIEGKNEKNRKKKDVYTSINSMWGVSGPTSLASIEFIGSNGAYAEFSLVGNVNIRDWADHVKSFLFFFYLKIFQKMFI